VNPVSGSQLTTWTEMWEAEPVFLRVRLDYCEISNGLTLFEGGPLDGVGLEVGAEDVRAGRSAGVVSMWRYLEGKRVNRWSEPWFGQGTGTILDASGRFGSTDGFPTLIFKDARVNGLEAYFDGPFLSSLRRIVDGEEQPQLLSWRRDGSVYRKSHYRLIESANGLMQVRQGAHWGDSDSGPAETRRATRIAFGLIRGEMDIVPRVAPQFEGDDYSPSLFVPFNKGDDRYHSSGYDIGLDEDVRINHFRMKGVGPFAALDEDTTWPEPISWRLKSVDDLVDLSAGTTITLDLDSTSADLVLNTLAGTDAFSHVERLLMPTYNLRADQVEAFLELPALIHVEIREQERFQNPDRQIRSLCHAFLRRKQNASVVFDQETLVSTI